MRKFKAIVEKEFEKDYYQQLHSYIEKEYQTKEDTVMENIDNEVKEDFI